MALSFDDGMDDNHSVVLPLLREHGLRATVYVTTGLIGKPNPWMAPESGARMMTVDELRELVAAGFEIGAHTVSHPDLSRLGFDECLREMRESRDELERTLGVEVRTFAYPSCHYGPAAVEAARAAGFTAAVTCQGLGSWKRYELRRSLVSGKDGTASFLVKLTGLYEPLFGQPARPALRAATTRAYRGTAAASAGRRAADTSDLRSRPAPARVCPGRGPNVRASPDEPGHEAGQQPGPRVGPARRRRSAGRRRPAHRGRCRVRGTARPPGRRRAGASRRRDPARARSCGAGGSSRPRERHAWCQTTSSGS